MIYLGASRTNIPAIAETWKTDLYKFLFENRKVYIKGEKKGRSTYDSYYDKMEAQVNLFCNENEEEESGCDWLQKQIRYFKKNFDIIVLANENEMKNIISYYRNEIHKQKSSIVKYYAKLMTDLYNNFRKHKDPIKGISNSHKFFKLLNIRTCPYCNRQYTFTFDKHCGKAAPEYDHFYNKKDYPILAVSFYNLVPSCHTCNHLKGTKKISVNPFFNGFKSKFVFITSNGAIMTDAEVLKQCGGKLSLRNIDKDGNNKDEDNIETFGLNELYEQHGNYACDIISKFVAYNPEVQSALVNAFQGPAYHPQQVFDFVWGKYLEDSQLENRTLSKLTKDILDWLRLENSL